MIYVYNRNIEEHTGPNNFPIFRGGSILGNPYTDIKDKKTLAQYVVKTKEEAVKKYSRYFDIMYNGNIEFKKTVDTMYEKYSNGEDIYLECYCKQYATTNPNYKTDITPCHGDIIKQKLEARLIKEKIRKKDTIPMILTNEKWKGIWNQPKYQEMREKIVNTFNELEFEEGSHRYFLRGKELTCVSNVTHRYKPPFNTEEMAQGTFERNFDNPDSIYYQKSVEEIKAMWKEKSAKACEHGTNIHAFAESCFYFMTEQFDKIPDEFQDRIIHNEDGTVGFEARLEKEISVVKFYSDMPQCFVPILAETKVYSEEEGYSGTFDLLTYYDSSLDAPERQGNPSGLVVMDWKTNEDLRKTFRGSRLLAPFDELPDMSLSLYKLQLTLYENCLIKIGMPVIALRIMWLKPDTTYEKINIENIYLERIKEDLKNNPLKIIS